MSSSSNKNRILLAEDNPYDVLLLREAFSAEKLDIEIDCVRDGDQLLGRLLELADDGGGQEYGIVLLDFHLPRRSAEEVLLLLNQQQRRVGIPLVILTTMISEQHKKRLFSLGVSQVLAKPFDLQGYFTLAQTLSSLLIP